MVLTLTSEKLSEYKLDDIQIGQKKQFSVTVLGSMIDDFAKLSGDHSPIHVDETYANSTNFKKRICHGMLLASFFSRLVGMYLPGKNALYFSQSLKFISPCFINDNIIIEGEVIEKSTSTRLITLKTTITNNTGNRLVDGEAKVLLRE